MTREELIIWFYEDGKINTLFKIVFRLLERRKNEHKHIGRMDTNGDNTILIYGNNNTRTNKDNEIFNNEEIKKEIEIIKEKLK